MKCGAVYSVVVEDYIKKDGKVCFIAVRDGWQQWGDRRLEGAESIFLWEFLCVILCSVCNSLENIRW